MPPVSPQSPMNQNASRVLPPLLWVIALTKKGPVSGTDHGAF